MYTKKVEQKVEDRLLATHISKNADFEKACYAGDGSKIMSIVKFEMENNNLYTKGSQKLHDDIYKMLKGKTQVSPSVGTNILFFVYNSLLSGTGHAVTK
jgi:hypothetical protein